DVSVREEELLRFLDGRVGRRLDELPPLSEYVEPFPLARDRGRRLLEWLAELVQRPVLLRAERAEYRDQVAAGSEHRLGLAQLLGVLLPVRREALDAVVGVFVDVVEHLLAGVEDVVPEGVR